MYDAHGSEDSIQGKMPVLHKLSLDSMPFQLKSKQVYVYVCLQIDKLISAKIRKGKGPGVIKIKLGELL